MLCNDQGTKGEIQIDGFEGGGRLYTMGDGGGVTTTPLKKVGWDASYALEMADFAAAVLDGTPLAAGPEAAAADLRLMLTCMKACKTNVWEKVAELSDATDCAAIMEMGAASL